jgi:hypothetical protein
LERGNRFERGLEPPLASALPHIKMYLPVFRYFPYTLTLSPARDIVDNDSFIGWRGGKNERRVVTFLRHLGMNKGEREKD